AGRSRGVKVSLVQYPCRSGCPSGVRGMVQAFVLAAELEFFLATFFAASLLLAGEDCATAKAGTNKTLARPMRKAFDRRARRLAMGTSSTSTWRAACCTDRTADPRRLRYS